MVQELWRKTKGKEMIGEVDLKVDRINKERCPKCNTTAVYKIYGYCWVCWHTGLTEFQRFFIRRKAQKEKKK